MWKDGVWSHDQVHLTGIMCLAASEQLVVEGLEREVTTAMYLDDMGFRP